MVDFTGPMLKAERATHHISELESIFVAYERANKQSLTRDFNVITGVKARVYGATLPDHTPTVLGDALHNLRVSLDHAYCILVEANGATIGEQTKFPFGKKPGSWAHVRANLDKDIEKGLAPSRAVVDYISDVIQPYVGGAGSDLLDLHILDIADKHMVLLPTKRLTTITNMTDKNGNTFNLCSTGFALDFLFINTDIRNNPNMQASITPCFGAGQPLEGQEIIPTLHRLHGRVVDTLRSLQAL